METLPRLYTERLILKKIEIDDIPSLVKYANNPKIAERIVNIPYPYREPEATFRIAYVFNGIKNKTHYSFAIIHKSEEELIGEISIHLLDKHQAHGHLSYWVGEPFWNKGIITEAANEIMKFGFKTLNLDLIYAMCSPDNKASERVMQKIGLTTHKVVSKELVYKCTQAVYIEKEKP